MLAVGVAGASVVYAFAASCNDARYAAPNCDTDQWDLFRSSDGSQNWTALGLRSKAPTNPLQYGQPDMNVKDRRAGTTRCSASIRQIRIRTRSTSAAISPRTKHPWRADVDNHDQLGERLLRPALRSRRLLCDYRSPQRHPAK